MPAKYSTHATRLHAAAAASGATAYATARGENEGVSSAARVCAAGGSAQQIIELVMLLLTRVRC